MRVTERQLKRYERAKSAWLMVLMGMLVIAGIPVAVKLDGGVTEASWGAVFVPIYLFDIVLVAAFIHISKQSDSLTVSAGADPLLPRIFIALRAVAIVCFIIFQVMLIGHLDGRWSMSAMNIAIPLIVAEGALLLRSVGSTIYEIKMLP